MNKNLELSEQVINGNDLEGYIYFESNETTEVRDLIYSPNHTQKHKELLSELHETYKDKNHKYGDSFTETVNKYGLMASLTRMHDKFSRIENIILNQAKDDEEERLSDSLKDLANYCLMTVMVLENEDE